MASLVWKTFHINGSGTGGVPLNGALKQYSTFRYHGGGLAPRLQLAYWNEMNALNGGRGYLRFGLRNTSGDQVGASLQFNKGEEYVWKSFATVPAGNYALNARAQVSSNQNDPAWVDWVGTLQLRQYDISPG